MSDARHLIGVDMQPALDAAAAVLLDSGIVAFPTETVYGLGVCAGDVDAIHRLRICKGRDGNKPFQILIADFDQVDRFAQELDDNAKRLIAHAWPGPMTLILRGRYESTVGLRLPDHPFVRALARAVGGAIVATSANAAGMPPAVTADEVEGTVLPIDLLIDGGAADQGTASTVVSYLDGEVKILRAGGVTATEIFEFLPQDSEKKV